MFGPWLGSSKCFDEYMLNRKAVHLRDRFRLLWEQHAYWTRMVIISIAMDLPDLEAHTARLLRNATDFAKIFNHFYGSRVAFDNT